MIRTGKTIEQITGDELLYYADVVKTSGRQPPRAPALGTAGAARARWPAKPRRCGRRGRRRATLASTRPPPWSTVTASHARASGTCSWTISTRFEAGMDYGSLEGLAYRLVRLFWWEVLQINPTQSRPAAVAGRSIRHGANGWRSRPTAGRAGEMSLDPVRDPRLLPRPGRMVPRRSGALGHLGRALSGAARLSPRSGEGQAPPAKARCKAAPAMLTPLLPAFVPPRTSTSAAAHCSSASRSMPGRGANSTSTASRSFAIRRPSSSPQRAGACLGTA